MTIEKGATRSEIVWKTHNAVAEQIRHQDKATSLTQLRQLRAEFQLPWYVKQKVQAWPDASLSPHKPIDRVVLQDLVGSDETRWIDGLFSQSGENSIDTGLGWGFHLLPNGFEVIFTGVLLRSTPGHVVISGDNSFHIDASRIDEKTEEVFRNALAHAVNVRPGFHRISSLNLNPKIIIGSGFPTGHTFE